MTLKQDKILYIADYRLFIDGKQEIEVNNLEAEIIYKSDSNDQMGTLRLKNNATMIETVAQASVSDLDEIKNKILMRYKSDRENEV
ncbi:MAG: hypothetical protein JJU02_04740 [Cryomorphaceae bacterium]|nr:hypothetical protein [Cryomorphaceae bacterium]